MENIPSYFLDSNSYWEWFKGGLAIWFQVFIHKIWWIPVVAVLGYCIGTTESRALLGTDVKLNIKDHLNVLKVITLAYAFFVTFIFAPFEVSCRQQREWDAFVTKCIKEDKYELVRQIREIRKQNQKTYWNYETDVSSSNP